MKLWRLLGGGALLLALCGASSTCRTSRFPTCETDDQCAERDEGATKRFCFDLRCVECRNDGDCKAGQVCNLRTNTCEAL